MDFDLAQLRALNATVAEGSFEAAARELNVTPSAVSQRIKALESAVGAVLVQRTKPVRVTESGQAVLRLARQIDVLASDARRELGGAPGGERATNVPVAVNADSLATWILPAFAGLEHGPAFDIHLDDQEHTTGLLRSGTVMAAITATAQPIQGCTSTLLGTMRYRARCSEAFAAAWLPDGPTREALDRAPVVVFDRKDDLQHRYLRLRTRATPPTHYIPGSTDFAEAVRLGLGWGMLPDQQTQGWEEAGDTVDFDPGHHDDITLYWQQWALRTPALDTVADLIKAAAARALS